MSKTARETDKLNISLSAVSAIATVAQAIITELPESNHKKKLLDMMKQIEANASDGRASLRTIRKAAEII